MKVTFFSNFLNHHQLPFCLELSKMLGNDFKFVATEKIPTERLALGYDDMNTKYDFVIRAYEDIEAAYKYGEISDVVIIGSSPSCYIKKRIKQKKLTFRYSERIFRNGVNLKVWLALVKNYTIGERKNVYLLCSSAYSTRDFNIAGAYIGKCFKWGYFPEVKHYDLDELFTKKAKNNKVKIIWVARFLELKHPEKVIELAKRLKNDKIHFSIEMIGIGPLYNEISLSIESNNLTNEVKLLGAINNKDVRKHMEESNIFLFTSDYNEGWGAVLNEAMNSGCAVVASHAIGSVPFLINHGINGLVYKDGSFSDFYEKTKDLILNKEKQIEYGKNAYYTMTRYWNAEYATKKLLELSKCLLNNKQLSNIDDGPCSKAKFIWQSKMYDIVTNKSNIKGK